MSDNMVEQSYKDTIFLPKTDFPMRAELAKKEPGILAFWQKINIFRRLREQSADRSKKTLHWGPPYANGSIHIGHALSETLKDQVVKFWQMQGFHSSLVPGWDCHGLPIEWKIEEQYRARGQDKNDVAPLTFRQECRDFAAHWITVQSEALQRLGIIGDWQEPYVTMSTGAEAQIVEEVHKFLCQGALYRGLKPVMWSTVEKTALAEAEVEYRQHESDTVWVEFPVAQTDDVALERSAIVIWTTTPWSLPSNLAIAFNSDIDYGLYRKPDGNTLIIADSLAGATKDVAKIESLERVCAVGTENFNQIVCHHPLHSQGYKHDVRLFSADFVTDKTGTGFVHIAPAHGEDDFLLAQEHGIEFIDNVLPDGYFADHVPVFAGMPIYTEKGKLGVGNHAVIRSLEEAGRLLGRQKLTHDYPHSWRSKAPIIYRAAPQWFIKMNGELGLREKALQAISETRWIPSPQQRRIVNMVSDRPDWCISRQRVWGVPLAFFIDKATGEPLLDEVVLGRISTIFKQEGSDAWWARPASDFLGDRYDPAQYEQIFDIVDVWFESGCTHAFVLEKRDDVQWPADLYLEGSDQHRGWFQSSLLESCGTRGRAPYKAVMTHGFTLDEKGQKMSKSLNNVVDPADIIKIHGADIIRLWAITSNFYSDISIGENIIRAKSDTYRRFRNTFRYLLGAVGTLDAVDVLSNDELSQAPTLEQYILHKLSTLEEKLAAASDDFSFGQFVNEINNFCVIDLSSFYFDIRKDRLYCDDPNSFEHRAYRTVILKILECLSHWLAPTLSFTCEEVWTHYPKAFKTSEPSIHMTQMPSLPKIWRNPDIESDWDNIRKLRSVVTSAIEPYRQARYIGSSLEAHPIVYLDRSWEQLVSDKDLAEVCVTSQLTVSFDNPPESAFRLDDVNGVAVVLQKAKGRKCARSWKILPDVGSDPDYPDISARDAQVLRALYANKEKL